MSDDHCVLLMRQMMIPSSFTDRIIYILQQKTGPFRPAFAIKFIFQ